MGKVSFFLLYIFTTIIVIIKCGGGKKYSYILPYDIDNFGIYWTKIFY